MAGLSSGLAQQLTSLNQLIQAQQRMQNLVNGLVNPDEENIAEEERRKKEQEEKHGAVEASKKFRLRICVYSGEDLPRDTTYVYLRLLDQVHGDKSYKSGVSSETTKPVWEFFIEDTMLVDGTHGPPRLEIQLYGQRVLLDVLDRYLGQAVLKLSNTPTLGPVKTSLPVALNSLSAMNDKLVAQFGVLRKPRLNVVWQVCDDKQPVPDLIRIAEMDEAAADKRSYQCHLKLVSVKLRRATEGPRRLAVSLRLIQPDGEVSKVSPVQNSPQVWTCPENKIPDLLAEGMPMDPDEECNTAVWREDNKMGWQMPTWALRESHLQLLSYNIEAQLLLYGGQPTHIKAEPKKFRFWKPSNPLGQQEKPAKLGVWRDSLGDLLDSIENADQGIVCEAVVGSSKEGSEVATLRMEIDVSATRAHRIPRELACKEVDGWPLEKAPLRRGAPAKEILQNKVQYFVTVMVDGLPGHELCLPYVRVSMGAVSECTEAKKAHSVNNVTFDKALSINCTLVNRKAKIEILNRGSGGVFSRDKVIGEGVIYDVEPDKEYWIHCFGGAANATYPDVANQMVKGAVRPASTHTASVAVKFGTKMVSKVYFESLKRMRKPSRLTVRLYSGVNLKSYAGRKVNVVVKVPGGRLPDEAGAWHIWQNHQELERLDLETSPSHVTMLKRKALLEASDAPPQQYNTSLLAFPGEVDACGELHFVEQKARVRWVQRSTPKAWPLELPPNVQFAYLYVVAAGEEIEPPRVFGRLRLLQSDLDQVPPKWKTLHFDTSVVELPEAYYKSDLAGFLLGCASVQEQEPKVGQPPASAPSWGLCGSKPSMLPSAQTSCCAMTSQVCRASMGEDVRCQLQRPERKRTVWLHMDLLQARELPAMDDDGLVDPSYKLEVKDQTVLFPSGIMKSLSPSFMHRVCIPIEMEVEPEPTADLPLMGSFVPFPPLIVRILDRDERKVLGVAAGDDFEEVGCFVIKPASTRTLVSHGNETGKVETFPLLGYEEDEDYVLGEGGGLFAAKMPPDLDLNRLHVAKWYSLEKPGEAPFDAATGGVEDSWHKRPRVLAAANYSLQTNLRENLTQGKNLVKGAVRGVSIHQIQTHQSSCFKIDFRLLGLRNLPDSLVDCKLYVSSFWEGGALELAIGSSQYHRNFNFMADDLSEGWRQGAERLKPLLRVVADDDAPMRDRELVVWTAKLKDLAGLKIQPPPYEVPVIPYLQQDTLKPGRWTLQDLDTGHEFDVLVHYEPGSHAVEVQKFDGHRLEDVRHPGNIDRRRLEIRFTLEDMEWCGQVKSLGTFMPLRARSLKDPKAAKNFSGTWHEEDPFVLLPAITFQLKNPLTAADHGTLTVALNQMNTRQSESNSWMQVCQEEFARLPQGLRSWSGEEGRRSGSIQPLRGVKYTDDAYDTLVDVFATRSGFVEFDQNLFISRTLQDNCLFNICPNSNKDEDGERSDCVTQFFNLFDVLAGDTRRLSEPFDERFWPQLCCGPGYDKESRPELPQLGESPDREDLAKAIGKLMAWIDAKEKSIHHSQPRPTQPLPPSKLFEKFFQIPKVAAYAGISRRSDLEKMSTTELQRKLKGAGWRFSTHLAAPELVPGRVPALAPLKYFTDSQLSVNRHTFMVQVGHRIGKHRDSRILCRLRMDVPKNFLEPYRKLLRDCQQMMASDEVELEERGTFSYGTGSWSPKSPTVGSAGKVLQNLLERLRRIEDGSSNYFMVKFKQPGIVVWAAPDAQKAWDRPGTLLFAVKLAHQPDTIVPVVVPSFDLRYPQESSWKVQKTMQMRYHDLERRIACGLEKEKAAKGNETIRRSPAAPEREEPEAVEDLNDEEALSSGSRRMAISCDSFICRLQRKAAGLPFDREQNSDWYRLVVGESFPEVRAIKGPDEVVKEYFFSKFMNLQRTLALPSELGETVLKGHVNVEKVERHEAREGHLDTCEFAVENLWTTSSFFVALTLCTFTKLDYNVDFSEIYFKIKLGAEEQLTPVFRPNAQGKIMAVYHWATFETLLPVAHELTIQAYSKAALGFDAFIGECKFDLEDRCLALKWKEFRSSTNNEFLRNHVSPGERNRFYSITAEEADESLLPWKAPEKPSSAAEGRGLEVRPTRSPGVRLPMESKVMSMKDDLNADSRVGLLRCVLDLHPQSCPEQPLLPKAQRFEIRLSIIDVDNIKVYKDFGQRNDLFVEVKFRSASLEGSEQRRSEKTDIHRWAHAFASFNERFLFDVTAPAVSCGMDFELMDFDRGVSSADLVYYPQTFSMDHLLELAYDSWSNGREPLGPIAGTVVFDSWPSTNMLTEGWRLSRCLRRRRQQRGNAAKLNLTVEILPYELAQQSPAIAGVFAPPKDRLSLQMLASDPRKTARVVLGPKLFNAIIVSVVLGTTLVVTFLIVLIVFYTQSIIQQTGG